MLQRSNALSMSSAAFTTCRQLRKTLIRSPVAHSGARLPAKGQLRAPVVASNALRRPYSLG
eukprot:1847522-Lingulodinium_polyedra.AAC.1